MYKIETICDSCDAHFVIVTQEETSPSFCPFCSNPYTVEEELELSSGEEE